jgi:hypothetical protein
MKYYKLRKPLPGCPKGRVFIETPIGSIFHSISDVEVLSGEYQPYTFLPSFITDDWFELITDTYKVKVYDALNPTEFNEVDTKIPMKYVENIESILEKLNKDGGLKSTPLMFVSGSDDIQWGITETKNNVSKIKYRILIEKVNEKD